MIAAAFAALLVLPPHVPTGGGADEPDRTSWLDLDRTLEERVAALGAAPSDVGLGAMLRSFYAYSDDEIATLGGSDVSGVALNDADVHAEASFGDFRARVGFDLSDGTAMLEDAFGAWTYDGYELRFGQVKPFFLRSNAVDPEHLAFKERTLLGALYDDWQTGVMLSTPAGDSYRWWFSVTDGDDGQESDHRWVARTEFGVYEGGAPMREGSRGSIEFLQMSFGAAFLHDDSAADDNEALAADTQLLLGPHSLALEWAELDDGAGGPVSSLRGVSLDFDGNANPWSATYGNQFARSFQALVRVQDMDDSEDTQAYSFALHWFPDDRPIHWLVDVTRYDRRGFDGTVFQAGVVVGLSRPEGVDPY